MANSRQSIARDGGRQHAGQKSPQEKTQGRIEKDALGEIKVGQGRYWGSFTQRALETFGWREDENSIYYYMTYVKIKLACARANHACGMLETAKKTAIEQACAQALDGGLAGQFPLGFYQAGAGTPFNMNVNEVIANRANEIMGAPLGSYRFVHPNNDVNMCQSSNDLGPTAIRVAMLELSRELEKSADALCISLDSKAKKYAGMAKVGRTHLQDAVPVGIGQEIMAWSDSIKADMEAIERARKELLEVPLGGTALGTGIAAHPEFAANACAQLSKICNENISPMGNKHAGISMLGPVLAYASAIKRLDSTLVKVSNDMKILMSGPKAGIAELLLPEVEPGSSIMPGKINPSVPEAVEIMARDAMAKEHAIEQAAAGGQLQLNVLTPLAAKNIIEMIKASEQAIALLDRKCVAGMEYDLAACRANMDRTYVLATALNPYLGYQAMAEIVKESLRTGKPVKDVVALHGLMGRDEMDGILNPAKLTSPQAIDQKLAQKIRQSESYKKYLQKTGKEPK
ncbi:MAG: lyase family protein [Candidatus Micrarchaeia archaeon]